MFCILDHIPSLAIHDNAFEVPLFTADISKIFRRIHELTIQLVLILISACRSQGCSLKAAGAGGYSFQPFED